MMRLKLRSRGLLEIVEGDGVESVKYRQQQQQQQQPIKEEDEVDGDYRPTNEFVVDRLDDNEFFRRRDAEASGLLLSAMTRRMRAKLRTLPSAAAMWESLEDASAEATTDATEPPDVTTYRLLGELWGRAFRSEDENVHVYLASKFALREQLTKLQVPITDLEMAEALLTGLPETTAYVQLASALQYLAVPLALKTIQELIVAAARRDAQLRRDRQGAKGFGCGDVGHIRRHCPSAVKANTRAQAKTSASTYHAWWKGGSAATTTIRDPPRVKTRGDLVITQSLTCNRTMPEES